MSATDTTLAGRMKRLAELPPHEAIAVFWKLHEELYGELLREFEALQMGLALSLGKGREAEAGMEFASSDRVENQAYLAGLVARVKGGEVDA